MLLTMQHVLSFPNLSFNIYFNCILVFNFCKHHSNHDFSFLISGKPKCVWVGWSAPSTRPCSFSTLPSWPSPWAASWASTTSRAWATPLPPSRASPTPEPPSRPWRTYAQALQLGCGIRARKRRLSPTRRSRPLASPPFRAPRRCPRRRRRR
jgi:hypothetical protein